MDSAEEELSLQEYRSKTVPTTNLCQLVTLRAHKHHAYEYERHFIVLSMAYMLHCPYCICCTINHPGQLLICTLEELKGSLGGSLCWIAYISG